MAQSLLAAVPCRARELNLTEYYEGTWKYNSVAQPIRAVGLKVSKVEEVENAYLRGCYMLKKEEWESRYPNLQERTLYHSTSRDNVRSILSNNFDWRRVERSRFGFGVSFSPNVAYANDFCTRCNNGKAIIVTKVLVGQTSSGGWGQELPDFGSDTSLGRGDNVYVKYTDHEFYPVHVVYYK